MGAVSKPPGHQRTRSDSTPEVALESLEFTLDELAALEALSSDENGMAPLADAPALAELLADVERFVSRFVVFQNRHQRAAAALWVAHVYVIEAASAAAYLRIKSAAEESGKTTLLEVLELLLGEHGVNAVSISPAALFRFRDKVGPIALLLDEVDNTVRNRNDDGARDLLALVNAGYRRSATAIRTTGQNHEAKRFAAFGPAAIAGIGHLHPTTESRCIPILLDRKPRGEGERWIRFQVEAQGRALADRLEAWATDEVIARLRDASPQIVEELRDRHVETWWLLWAIADEAGGDWPTLARDAARALHLDGEDVDAMTTGVLLLAHIRDAFEEAGTDRMATVDLLKAVTSKEEGPWGKWWGSEVRHEENPQAAAVDLARHLRAFKVKPKQVRIEGANLRGYVRDAFEEAWARYLPPPAGGSATPATPATPLARHVAPVAPVAGGPDVGTAGPDYHGNGIPGFPGVVAAIRRHLEDQPDAEPQDITEELGYAPATVRAALARIEEES
jgi:hypothetical protein